ncbi:MAG: MFS transporter [Limnochordales bacterium]|nr:MFS transporter [Limnochordales bacterium]
METWRKLAYSFGSLGSALLSQAFNTYILFFYVDTLKAAKIAIGNVMFLYGIWNAINDPLFGLISDRTSTRFGRRRPYIALGTIPLMIAFYLLWRPPYTAAEAGKLIAYYALLVFLWDGLYTLVILNWTALFPEMFVSLAERSRVSAYRQMFGILGMVLGIALAPAIYGSWGWPAMGLIFALISGISIFISLLGSQERHAGSSNRQAGSAPPLGLVDALRYTLANRSFAFYVAGNFLVQLVFLILTAVLPFYTKYVLGLDSFQTSLLLLTVFAFAFAAMPFWSRYTIRKGARHVMLVGTALFAIFLWGFWLASDLLTALVTGALVGVALAALMMLFDVLLADIIDEDEVRVGQRREGAYFGIQAFIFRLGISIQAVLVTRLLDASGYVPDAAVQPQAALMVMRLLLSGIPALLLLLAFVAIWYYPLHGARLRVVREALANRE